MKRLNLLTTLHAVVEIIESAQIAANQVENWSDANVMNVNIKKTEEWPSDDIANSSAAPLNYSPCMAVVLHESHPKTVELTVCT
jgi:hypothetical protein